jgi:hopanoid C-3 methylase HpnR
MKVLFVNPGPLPYTKVLPGLWRFIRLEPLGLEIIAEAARRAGHEVKLIDLQVESDSDYVRMLLDFEPEFVGLSCSYLANVPEVVDLAKKTKAMLSRSFVCVGGHSASFTAQAILAHGEGAIDCVLKGEGEASIARLLEAVESDRSSVAKVPGAFTALGEGPPPHFVHSLDEFGPARDLLRHRRKYFIGALDPCASIELSRGCPWDCSFCSAWTFYGRSYRLVNPERVIQDIEKIQQPGIFITDDVAFINNEHGMAIAEAIAKKGIRKNYFLETRGDVLLRNKEVFKFWKSIGLKYMYFGVEAIDQEGLNSLRKRTSLSKNFEALEFARSLGIEVAIGIIADPDWDEQRFAAIREWGMEMPEIINISVNTPYPGTESWITEPREISTVDYRLFDIQHAVMPTRLPLAQFYRELLHTQRVLYLKQLNWRTAPRRVRELMGLLLRNQTNFLRAIYLHPSSTSQKKMLDDHSQPVTYKMSPRPSLQKHPLERPAARAPGIYIHAPKGRAGRHVDGPTEQFVNSTR